MSQNIETLPLLPASQDDSPVTPPVVVAVPVKSRGRPKKPATEEEKAAAEAVKAEKEAEKKAKEEEKAKKEAEKAAEKAKKEAEKAAKEAEKAEKDANKKPRGRPKKESPTIPTHNPDDVAEIAHLHEDLASPSGDGEFLISRFSGNLASDESALATLRAEIAALKNENKRLTDLLASVRSLVA